MKRLFKFYFRVLFGVCRIALLICAPVLVISGCIYAVRHLHISLSNSSSILTIVVVNSLILSILLFLLSFILCLVAWLGYSLRTEEYWLMNFFDYYDSAKRKEFEQEKEKQHQERLKEMMANPPRGGSCIPPLGKTISVDCNDN